MKLIHLPKIQFTHQFILLGILIINYIFNYFFNAFLTRHYTPVFYGQISLVLMTLIWAIPFVSLGSNLSSIRFLPEYLIKHEVNKFSQFIIWAKKIFYFSSIILCLISLVIIFVILNLEYRGYNLSKNLSPVTFSFWLIPLFGLVSLQSSILISVHKQALSLILWGIYPLLSMFILWSLSLLMHNLNIYDAFISVGLSLLIIIFLQYINIKIILLSEFFLKKQEQVSIPEQNLWLHVSLHLMLNSIIFTGIGTVNIFLLALLGHNKEILGEFSVLNTLMGLFLLIQNASSSFLSPLVIPYTKTEKFDELQVILNKSFFFRFGIGLLTMIIFLFFGQTILGFFGDYYVKLYYYLLILTIIYFYGVNTSFSITLLTLTEHQRIVTKVILFELIWVFLLNLILIPKYNLAGAIMSMCSGLLITETVAIILVKHYTKLKLFYLI